jgi:putative hemolysin
MGVQMVRGRKWFLVAIILLGSLALAACQAPSSEPTVTPSDIGLANPASLYCQEQGGALVVLSANNHDIIPPR